MNILLTELQTTLVPYQRIRFPICAYAPVIHYRRSYPQRLSVSDNTEAWIT
jgi:hypothetical protein